MGSTKRKNRGSGSIVQSSLLEPLLALQRLLGVFDNRGVIIGGIASSLLGRPRLTVDLDAVILLGVADIGKLIEAAADQGFTTRLANAESFARKNRVLLLRHAPSGVNIDISLGNLRFEVEMVDRGQDVYIGEIKLRLPTPEDLIIMKAVANRTKDLEDIRGVAIKHPYLDKQRIRYWVEQFGSALELPNLWNDIKELL